MQDQSGHNYRTALHADLVSAEARTALAGAAYRRAQGELERSCWQDNPHAPVDQVSEAKEFLRAAMKRRAEKRAEMADLDDDVIDHEDDGEGYDDYDDLAA